MSRQDIRWWGSGPQMMTSVFAASIIGEVAKYRVYDEDGQGALGGYGRIFEKEYARVAADYERGQMGLDASLDAGLGEDTVGLAVLAPGTDSATFCYGRRPCEERCGV